MEMSQLEIANKCRELIELSPPKFKVGDRVTSVKTGLPNIGTIMGVRTSYCYCVENPNFTKERWDNLFPNWRNKYVYTLIFDEAVISLNKEEYDYYDRQFPNQLPKYNELPRYPIIHYVEDDLELF